MPKLTWAVLCQDSAVDRERNNISLFQLIDQLNVPSSSLEGKETVLGIKLQLVFLLRREKNTVADEKYSILVEEIAPAGKVLFSKKMTVEFTGGKHRLRSIANLEGLPISGTGTHLFRLSMETKHGPVILSDVPLDIEEKKS